MSDKVLAITTSCQEPFSVDAMSREKIHASEALERAAQDSPLYVVAAPASFPGWKAYVPCIAAGSLLGVERAFEAYLVGVPAEDIVA